MNFVQISNAEQYNIEESKKSSTFVATKVLQKRG